MTNHDLILDCVKVIAILSWSAVVVLVGARLCHAIMQWRKFRKPVSDEENPPVKPLFALGGCGRDGVVMGDAPHSQGIFSSGNSHDRIHGSRRGLRMLHELAAFSPLGLRTWPLVTLRMPAFTFRMRGCSRCSFIRSPTTTARADGTGGYPARTASLFQR